MSVDELIDRLEDLGEVEIGHGPRHPTDPRPELAQEIAEFLDEHPMLRSDPEYVDFLERYAALLLTREEDFLTLSIFGFDPEVALHIAEGEGDIVTDGLLTFAHASVPVEEGAYSPDDPRGVAYAYDVSGERPPGVYRNLAGQPWAWYASGFRSWLETLVALEGKWV